jgi:hypothetical protein
MICSLSIGDFVACEDDIRLTLCSILVEKRNICAVHCSLTQWWLKNYGVVEYKSSDKLSR